MKMNLRRYGLMALATAFAMGAAAENYALNFPEDAKITHDSRYLKAILLTSPTDGVQRMDVPQQTDKLLFHDMTRYCFMAMPGQSIAADFDWEEGLWMHGYIYLDKGNDGEFDIILNEDSTRVDANCDAVAFSCFSSYDSNGKQFDALNVGVTPPAFTLPSDMKPGLYRMRYKVDWNSILPGGNDEAHGFPHQQTITKNGGNITDIMLYVHDDISNFTITSEHGTVTDAAGTALTNGKHSTGNPMVIKFKPDNGYQVKEVIVKSGYEIKLDNVEIASESLKPRTKSFPGYLIGSNTLTIPAENTYGSMNVEVVYCDASEILGGDLYACELEGSKDANKGITAIKIGDGIGNNTINVAAKTRHYFTGNRAAHALKGVAQQIEYTYVATGAASKASADTRLYIDINTNQAFDGELEIVSSAAAGAALPAFTVPEDVPDGVYRCRLQVGNDCAVDFLLNVHGSDGKLMQTVLNGYLEGGNGTVLPSSVEFGKPVTIRIIPTFTDYAATTFTVRHGHNLLGDQIISGNIQWNELEVEAGKDITIPAEAVDGDILVLGEFAEQDDSQWTLIFNDEFDTPVMDDNKWTYHPRYSSTWNKRHARSVEGRNLTNRFTDGMYDSYALPTPDELKSGESSIPMITGAIYTGGKFYCTGGYIECRMKTNPHTGNFPAFWMMPASQPNGWPKDGEIDIMEQIDLENRAYHTVHTAWRYKSFGAISKESPAFGGSETVDMSQFHTYALEWDQDALKWYVDGELMFTYENQHYSEGAYTEQFTWPYHAPFYIILNQSVGDGSWAKPADTAHTYLTQFDYVRAYQKKGELSYYSRADGHVSSTAIEDITIDGSDGFDPNAPREYYNLQGIRVDTSYLAPGIYIVKQSNRTWKELVR